MRMEGVKWPRAAITLLVLTIGWGQEVGAATPLPASALPGVVDRPEPGAPVPLVQPTEPEAGPTPEAFRAPADGQEPFAHVRRITFAGDLVIDNAALDAVARAYTGRDLTREDLARLKYDLTALHYRLGYPLVKVVTPPQSLSDGVLEVRIVLGRIGQVDIRNEGGLRPFVAEAMTWRLKAGEVFTERAAESVVQDINALGNLRGSLNLRRGQAPGTTDLRLSIVPADDDRQQVGLDNHGSQLTGRWVFSVDLRKSHLLGLGETFSLQLRKSNRKLKTAQLGFVSPIGLRDLHLEGRWLRSENGIGDRLAALRATGKTDIWGLALSSALVNTVQLRSELRSGFEHRRHRSFLAGLPDTDDRITRVFIEGNLLDRGYRHVLYGGMRISRGVGWLNADTRGQIDATRANGDPRAWIFTFEGVGRYRLRDSDVLTGRLRAQHASNALLSSDLFAIGGHGSVRGFEPAESTGERGLSLNLEYAHVFDSVSGWSLEAGPFADVAWVGNKAPGAVTDSRLAALGLGGEIARRWGENGRTRLRIEWAHPVGGYRSTTVSNNTFYLSLRHTF